MLTDDTSRKSHDLSEEGHSLVKMMMMMQLWLGLYESHVPSSLKNLIQRCIYKAPQCFIHNISTGGAICETQQHVEVILQINEGI